MWSLNKVSIFHVVCQIFLYSASTASANTLSTASGSFNTTGQGDIDFSSQNATIHTDEKLRRRLLDTAATGNENERDPIRILYTITTLSEYDKGTRATVKVSTILNGRTTSFENGSAEPFLNNFVSFIF